MRYAAQGDLRTSITIIIVCLVSAVGFTVAAEKWRSVAGKRMALAALFAMYGVCVGIASTMLVYFFSMGELASVALGIPLGVPVMYIAAKIDA